MERHLPLVLMGIVFLFAVSFFMFIFILWSESSIRHRRTIRKRLLYLSAGGNHGLERMNIHRNQSLKAAGELEKLLLGLPRISRLDRLLLRSDLPVDLYGFLLGSIIISLLTTAVGLFLLPVSSALALGVMSLMVPFLYLKIKEGIFLTRFTEQLPETIDLLARALRSGHALSSGFTMVVEEMENPVKSEIAAVVDEMKLGISLQDALANLCKRVPSPDLRFFAVAVLLQKETGGNLTEILDRISHLIRERMKFKRHVKTLTAEGRLSAAILLLLPVALFSYMYLVNYDYISMLWTEKEGYYLLFGGMLLMLLGAVTIKKITIIEV
jgi:tight adherence protein B